MSLRGRKFELLGSVYKVNYKSTTLENFDHYIHMTDIHNEEMVTFTQECFDDLAVPYESLPRKTRFHYEMTGELPKSDK